MATALEIRLLGGLQIEGGEAGAPALTRKARALLAYLASRGRDGQSRDYLASLFWCDTPERQARSNLRQTLSSIRKFLGPARAELLRTEKDKVCLDVSRILVDIAEFERLVGENDRAKLEMAADLYKGDFLDGFALKEDGFERWAQVERERFRGLASACLQRLLATFEGEKNVEKSISTATRLLYLDPVDERAHRALMRGYSLQNRHATALKQYETCRIALQKELDVEPQPETTDLFRKIRLKRIQRTDVSVAATPSSAGADHLPPSTLALPTRPSVCVVPFRNLVGNADDDYLADGVTENIVVALTRFSELFVVAHRSAARGAAQISNPAALAERLGVRYLLVGGVARIGERMRVTVNLTEAGSGEALWAERYDRELGDIFDLQKEISDAIVAKLFVRVVDADRRRTEQARTEDLDAYELVLRGRHLLKSPDKETRETAKGCFERAIELDASSASAHAWLACYHLASLFHPHAADHDQLVEQTFYLANKAVELDSFDYFARIMLANACYLRRDFENAHRHAQFSFDQNPNDYEVLCSKGWIDALCGNIEEGLACSSRAMRFNPLAPDDCLMIVGLAEFNSENYDAALAAFSAMRTFFAWKFAGMAASYVRLGNEQDAKQAAREFMEAASIEFEAQGDELRQRLQSYWHGLFIFQDAETGEKLFDGMRQAGIPI